MLAFGRGSCKLGLRQHCRFVSIPAKAQLDWQFLSNPANFEAIRKNIQQRKSQASIADVQALYKEIYLNTCIHESKTEEGKAKIEENLLKAALEVPNMCPQEISDLGTENKTIYEKAFSNPSFKVKKFEDIARILSGARLTNLGLLCGERSYFLTGVLAELEQALIQWTVERLLMKGFNLLSVPDILPPAVIKACGMQVDGERTQVYRLADACGGGALSGTAEMAVGGWLAGRTLEDLPLKLAAVSRCYRAETGGAKEEAGLYRVHQFTKVEMFVVTEGRLEASERALDEILALQRELFGQLGLSHRVLAMCPEELGDPAFRKYDIEAWMPGRQGGFWGEISSCSNCTDFQARRLGVNSSSSQDFCHTVNGTACAVPRMIIAICEQFQQENGSVEVPEVLRPFLGGRDLLEPLPKKKRPNLQWMPGANYLLGRE